MERAEVAVWLLALVLGTLQIEALSSSEELPPTVHTTAGLVRGFRQAVLGKTIHTFTGIRYGKPPVGQLRFSAPEPADPWEGTFDATGPAPSCVQLETHRYSPWQISGAPQSHQEDCLFLNVWTPADLSSSSRLAVMVWIHGGGLFAGSASMRIYDGAILSSFGDVVVVSINYRLASLGFLHGGTPGTTVNQGLLDQALALRWVKDNIEKFGGDPDLTTLIGESAGSASVEAHIISPVTRTLFKRAILQSGSLCMSIPQTRTKARHNLRVMAKYLRCANSSSKQAQRYRDILNCLRTVDPVHLRIVERIVCPFRTSCFVVSRDNLFLPNGMCVTDDHGGKDILIGQVENEGGMFVSMQFPVEFPRDRTPLNATKTEMTYFLGALIHRPGPDFLEKVHRIYMGHLQETDYAGLRRALHDVRGDAMMACPIKWASQRLARANNVYHYVLNYTSQNRPEESWYGMTHFDDVQYVFGRPLAENGSSADVEYSKKLMHLWTSFAKTGNPSSVGVPWPKVGGNSTVALKISSHAAEEMILDPDDRCRVWSS